MVLVDDPIARQFSASSPKSLTRSKDADVTTDSGHSANKVLRQLTLSILLVGCGVCNHILLNSEYVN